MNSIIKPQDLSQEFFTDEQCYITEVSNSSDDPELSIARARVEPGITTKWHRLKDVTERYVIVSGNATVEIGENLPTAVEAGDVVIIPPMCRQRISNTGQSDLIFLAICTPRFTNNSYEQLEN